MVAVAVVAVAVAAFSAASFIAIPSSTPRISWNTVAPATKDDAT